MGQANRRGTKTQRERNAKIIKRALLMARIKQDNPKIGLPIWLFACDVGCEDWVEKRMREILAGDPPKVSDTLIYRGLGMTLMCN